MLLKASSNLAHDSLSETSLGCKSMTEQRQSSFLLQVKPESATNRLNFIPLLGRLCVTLLLKATARFGVVYKDIAQKMTRDVVLWPNWYY